MILRSRFSFRLRKLEVRGSNPRGLIYIMNKEEIKKTLEETKKWNQNRLFLIWGVLASLVLILGLELFKILAKEYLFEMSKFLLGAFDKDGYLLGIWIFFILSLFASLYVSKIIDERANTFQKLYNTISNKSNIIQSC